MEVSIIIPAHNEEKRISRTLEEYSMFFKKKQEEKKLDYEISVVLNGCKDKTEEIVRKAEKKYKKIRALSFKQAEKGFAIIEGFKDALKISKSGLIGFVDADMSTSPKEFYKLIENVGDYDGVVASRYIKGSVIEPKRSIQRFIASRIFNFFIRSLFLMPYRDTQCGAKIFKREAVGSIIDKIGITKWAFDVDLLYQLRKEKMKIMEFPTYWSDKEYSKINLMDAGPSMFLAIIRLRLLNSWLKDFVRFYNKVSAALKK